MYFYTLSGILAKILPQKAVMCSPKFTSMNGAVKAQYEYDAFGTPYLANIDSGMSFGYTGKVFDSDTGLYDYEFRDYAPNSARFTTIDPVRDGANWFSYVVNDPINYIDPFGLTPFDVKRPNIELINSTIKPILYLACRVFNIIQFYAKFCIESELNVKNLYLYAKFY